MLTEVVLTHPCDTIVHLLAGAWTTPRGRHHPLPWLWRVAGIALPPGRCGQRHADSMPHGSPGMTARAGGEADL